MKRLVEALLLSLAAVVLLASCGTESTVAVPDEDILDQDKTGGDDNTQEQPCLDTDGDGFAVGAGCPAGIKLDCDDKVATVYPGAPETCGNGQDENCDGKDDVCPNPCLDLDKDGANGKSADCPTGTDCDDYNNTVKPGAAESCGNGVDENCDGKDDTCPAQCKDGDADGYMAPAADCPTGNDCDDKNNTIHPNGVEVCGNQVDENCDGKKDDCPAECKDGDGDGYGDGPDCEGYDCNDANAKVHPGATEVCGNGLDDDCVDGDLVCPSKCEDLDKDGFGVGTDCPVQDCNDADKSVYPGAPEVCGNGKDEDCSGQDLPCTCLDSDGDNYGQGDVCDGPDCNDSDPAINPLAKEVCGNDIDENCDGKKEECPFDCIDGDKDSYGTGKDCKGLDCDDKNAEINPAAQEICENGKDENCDGKDDACPPPNCEDDYDCGKDQLCDQASGTCRTAKVWEWWAPTFYVDTDPAGAGLDLIRSLNFDGDWNATNNVANLGKGNKKATVYYSFVKTSSHWYLGYYVFFPRRWTKWPLGANYENTMRGVLLVVQQDGSAYGKLVMMETMTEDTYFQYTPPNSPLKGSASIDGDINWDLFYPTDHHPVVYVHGEDHGIWGDAYLWNDVSNWDVSGFPGDTGVVYRFGNVAESPVLDNDEVYYELPALNDTLWAKKLEIGSGKLFNEFGHFNYSGSTSTKAVAPWRFIDGNYPLDPEGEILWNPADLVRRHFNTGWGTFSFTYVYNPYVVKVTIKDLGIYVTADPFGGDADPFVNLYMYDGGGYEQLMLSNFYGLQNNWYKSDVSVNTILDMASELGRNYFYGFDYPNEAYFGIQVRDYDGGWSGDEWLMDVEKTQYYDYTGSKLLDWGKSDSVIVVELP
jgi:hypothetical protein